MQENKNLESDKNVPKITQEGIGQSNEQQLEKGVEKLEAGLANLDILKQEVGGEQGIKETIAKMSPEEKQNIVNKIKQVIQGKMEGSKTFAQAGGALILCIILEYIGFKDLNEHVAQPDWYNASAVVFMGVEAVAAVAAFGVTAKKALTTIGDRIKLFKTNKQEVAA
jgi:hypothetical protein